MNKETEKLKSYSLKCLYEFSDTRSLKSLELEISNRPGIRLQYITAGYLYYNKSRIDKLKYPSLYKLREEFKKSLKAKVNKDSYYKVYKSYLVKIDKRERVRKNKEKAKDEILKSIEKHGIKISSLARACNVDCSSLSKFIKQNKLSEFSLDRVMILLRTIRNNYGK